MVMMGGITSGVSMQMNAAGGDGGNDLDADAEAALDAADNAGVNAGGWGAGALAAQLGPPPAMPVMPAMPAADTSDDSDDDDDQADGNGAAATTGTTVECFDIATRSWSDEPPIPHARRAFAAGVLLDGRVIVAGGATFEDEFLDSVYAFTPARRDRGEKQGCWEELAPMPAKRCSCSGNVLSNGLFVIAGGYSDDPATQTLPHQGGWLSSCLVYDPSENSWKSLPSM